MDKIFEEYIKTDNAVFRHARGKSIESGKEFHMYHEIIFFAEGDAEFISEDIRMDLAPNTLIVIPKETYHQLTIRSDIENYYRYVINFRDTDQLSDLICKAMGKRIVIMPSDKETEDIFKKLAESISSLNAPLLLEALLVLLLDRLGTIKNQFISAHGQNEFIRKTVRYINENIGRKITIDEIAKACMLSPSSLAHSFKKEMGISLHKYIVKKRLVKAYNKIKAGAAATTVAAECGFNDYSGFYKQYKKMFNMLPSEKQEN